MTCSSLSSPQGSQKQFKSSRNKLQKPPGKERPNGHQQLANEEGRDELESQVPEPKQFPRPLKFGCAKHFEECFEAKMDTREPAEDESNCSNFKGAQVRNKANQSGSRLSSIPATGATSSTLSLSLMIDGHPTGTKVRRSDAMERSDQAGRRSQDMQNAFQRSTICHKEGNGEQLILPPYTGKHLLLEDSPPTGEAVKHVRVTPAIFNVLGPWATKQAATFKLETDGTRKTVKVIVMLLSNLIFIGRAMLVSMARITHHAPADRQ